MCSSAALGLRYGAGSLRPSGATMGLRRASLPVASSFSGCNSLCTSQRFMMDKILVGATAAAITSSSTLLIFHLVVTPLTASTSLVTVVSAGLCGAMSFFDASGDSATSMGAIFGFIVGAMGGFYGKGQKEPWRK